MKPTKTGKASKGGKGRGPSFQDDSKITGEWINKVHLAKQLHAIKQIQEMRKARENMGVNSSF